MDVVHLQRRLIRTAVVVGRVQTRERCPECDGVSRGTPPAAPATAAMSGAATRARVLSLYRSILREARRMPTTNRRKFIEAKARHEFRQGATETDAERIQFLVMHADVSLDTVIAQADHLSEVFASPTAPTEFDLGESPKAARARRRSS